MTAAYSGSVSYELLLQLLIKKRQLFCQSFAHFRIQTGQTATTKIQRMNRAAMLPQCPPKAVTRIAGAKYSFHPKVIMNPTNPRIGRFFAPTGIS